MQLLKEIIEPVIGDNDIPDELFAASLASSVVPDSKGNMPGTDEYVPTYDRYFAAVTLVGFLRSKPVVTQASSEGTSITTSPTDWDSLIKFFSSQSSILSGASPFTVIPVRYPPLVDKVNMIDRGADFGDIDRDI